MQTQDTIVYKSVKYNRNKFDPETFIGKTTIVTGVSKSGKSFILNSILRSIAPYVNTLTVFSGTAGADKAFPMTNYTDYRLIYNSINIPVLTRAINTAMSVIEKYNMYITLKMLEMSARYLDKRYGKYIKASMKKKAEQIAEITKEFKLLKSPDKNTIDSFTNELVELYKKYVTGYKLIIVKRKIIVENATVCEVLKYVNYIKDNVIVLNDLTEEYVALTNKEKGIFDSILNKGRHAGITLIMLIHTWTGFGKQMRNSPHNFIFTSTALANNYTTLQNIKGIELRNFNDAIECTIARDKALPEKERKHICLLFEREPFKFSFIQADSRGKQVYVGIQYFKKDR